MTRPRAFPLLLAGLLSGCVATQRDMLDLSQQTDEIKHQVSEVKRSVASMQANQADLALKMDQVRSDLSAFTENMKDNQDRMSRLSAKLDDLEAVLGQKVSSLGESFTKGQQAQLAAQLASQKAAEQAARDAAGAAEEAAKKAADETTRKAAEAARLDAAGAGGPTPSQLYRSAQANLGKKHFGLAAEGFEAYLKKYPKGEMADLALFYLGEARYGLQQWEEAARQYALVLDRFPKSDLTPTARLKYSMSLMNLKSKQYSAEAKRYLQSILEDFPKAPEAATAAKLLKKLAGASTKGE